MKRVFSIISVLGLLFACTPGENDSSETDKPGGGGDGPASAPSVTIGAEHISAISVVLKGRANLGTSAAADLKVGFLYSKSAGIMPSNSTTVEAEDADADYNYTTGITGLEPSTTYYFRSFVRQNGQDTYGETKSFTTKDVASMLETKDASDIEATQATMNTKLDLTNVKYSNISCGFYWGTTEASQTTFINGGEIIDNIYSASLTNLSHKTQYWYKSYVELDGQTFYGEVKTFTTDVPLVVSFIKANSSKYEHNTCTFDTGVSIDPSTMTNVCIEMKFYLISSNGSVIFGSIGWKDYYDQPDGSDSQDFRSFHTFGPKCDVGSSRVGGNGVSLDSYYQLTWNTNFSTKAFSIYNNTTGSSVLSGTYSGTVRKQKFFLSLPCMKFKQLTIIADDITLFDGYAALDGEGTPCIYDSISGTNKYASGTNAQNIGYEP